MNFIPNLEPENLQTLINRKTCKRIEKEKTSSDLVIWFNDTDLLRESLFCRKMRLLLTYQIYEDISPR